MVQLTNTDSAYGWISIVIHWLMALLILFLFGLGLYMVELSYYDSWYRGSAELHKSLGVIALMLWCLRVLWRLVNRAPKPELANNKFQEFEQLAAHWMHRILYFVMILLMFSGYLISTADGRAIWVFDLLEVPALPALIDDQEDVAGEIHFILAWTLIILVSIHALAALKHHFVDKDRTLKRILKPQ